MAVDEFEALLKKTTGLDAASIGPSAIARAVQDRLSACNLTDAHAYGRLVQTSGKELQELIEAVMVPETWFFRDREAFSALTRMVFEEWLPANPRETLRLLSLPCSTGEEPYSMAIALLHAGLRADRFMIDAIDISTRAVAHAQVGIYGKNSFRGRDLAFRETYFEKVNQGYRLKGAVRPQVKFQSGNIFELKTSLETGTYDFIFCRNLLIYFDRPAQDGAIEVLLRLLRPKGTLFVGPAETGLLLNHRFVSTKRPMSFSFRKAPSISRRTKSVSVGKSIPQYLPPAPPKPIQKSEPIAPAPSVKAGLDEAAHLANQGRLTEAAKLCHEFLHANGPSAKAYHLLGLVRDAAGQPEEAAGFYRKALYLDPDHHETLFHLALLLEKQGDKSGSKVLNERAWRLEQKAGK